VNIRMFSCLLLLVKDGEDKNNAHLFYVLLQ